MITFIKTAHEEMYSNGSRTLGVLLIFDKNYERVDSLLYIYRSEMYIFFDTIMAMNEYLLYGDGAIKRAYLNEKDFDDYYDATQIDGNFSDKLSWTTKNVSQD